jgi:hypothetical protein
MDTGNTMEVKHNRIPINLNITSNQAIILLHVILRSKYRIYSDACVFWIASLWKYIETIDMLQSMSESID